jgi:hypothetical protein
MNAEAAALNDPPAEVIIPVGLWPEEDIRAEREIGKIKFAYEYELDKFRLNIRIVAPEQIFDGWGRAFRIERNGAGFDTYFFMIQQWIERTFNSSPAGAISAEQRAQLLATVMSDCHAPA